MKQKGLLKIFFGAIVFTLLSFICFLLFYVPRIKFHQPVSISVQGLSQKQSDLIKIYGITPLGRKGLVDIGVLSSADNTLLFSELEIDLSSITTDSVSEIQVIYGTDTSHIAKNEIGQWYKNNKAHPLFPLSRYSGDHDNTLTKLKWFRHISWGYVIKFSLLYIRLGYLYVLTFFSLSVSILFFTIILPLFFIIIILIRKPISEFIIPVEQTGLAKGIFFICLFVFLAVQIYSIGYYKLFLQADAAPDMVYYFSHDIYHAQPPGTYRLACILTNFVLLPCVSLHLPVTLIAHIYCLHFAFFNLFIALSILFLTRRYDLAAVVLAAPILLLGINYYYIFNELFFCGSLMILYIAVYQGIKEGVLKKLILFPCLIYIIWSHPATIMILAVFMAGTYKSPAQILKDKWTIIFMGTNVIARLIMLNGFDHSKIHELLGGISFGYIIYFVWQYVLTYWFLVLLLTISIYISMARHLSLMDYTGVLMFIVILYFSMGQNLAQGSVDYSKYLYSVNLFILMQGIVVISRYWTAYKKKIMAGTFLILIAGVFTTFFSYHPIVLSQVITMETINKMCLREDPNQSKWYIREDPRYKLMVPISHLESILFSSYQNLPVTIQVVRGDKDLKNRLDSIAHDQYYFYDGCSLDIKQLDPYYFHFKEGPYKEFVLDSVKVEVIKKACATGGI